MKPNWRYVLPIALAICAVTTVSMVTAEAHATSACTWVSITPCNFGKYDNTVNNTTGALVFNCTANDSPVTLQMTSGGSGNPASRYFNGAPSFGYQIYSDAAKTNYFGSTAAHQVVINTPALGDNTYPIYCQIPANENPATGGYTDNCSTRLLFGASNLSLGFDVYTTVNGTCTVSTTTNLAFGAYDPIVANASTPRNGTGVVSVNCTSYLPYTVTLDQGQHPAAGSSDTTPLRQMVSGANVLGYTLYQDPARTIIFGNTPGTGVANIGNGAAQSVNVRGRIPAGQQKPAGSYADTVVVTVTF